MARDSGGSGEWTSWDWFKAGCLLGAVYALLRNPGGAACLVGCAGLIALLAIVFAVVVIYTYWWVAFGILVLFVLWRFVLPWWRTEQERKRRTGGGR